MRAYSVTVGATDGNIIAAIITAQTPRNQPSAPSGVPGPSSIPLIRSAVDHHATAPRPNSSATRPSRARSAPKVAGSAVTSGGPGEVRLREPGAALVLDPEPADVRSGR